MQKSKLIFSLLAVVFGFLIVLSSLIVSSGKKVVDSENISEKKLYLDKKILPDHIFYPFLMIVDKGLLIVATGESEIFLRIRLAQDRMLSAQGLLQKGEESLALSTLTKSQKYLIIAAHQYLSSKDNSLEVGRALLQALQENTKNLQNSQVSFTTVATEPISALIVESETLIAIFQGKVR